MDALIPNKDTLLFLARVQKKVAAAFNSVYMPEYIAVPRFPLWAFSVLPENIISCTILSPETKERQFFFPVKIEYTENEKTDTKTIEIIFADILDTGETSGNKKSSPSFLPATEEIKDCFPRKERVFRTGLAVIENNGWQLFDDRWHKSLD